MLWVLGWPVPCLDDRVRTLEQDPRVQPFLQRRRRLVRSCLLSVSFSVEHVEPVLVRLAQNATHCIPHVVRTAEANVCKC